MNYYRLKSFTLAAVTASSVMMLTSCSNDEVEQLNTGSEIRFSTKVSRASVTDLSSLKEFYVYGLSEGAEDFFIKNECATQSSNGIYKLSRNYYWPDNGKSVSFWAFGAANLTDNQTGEKSPIQFNTTDKAINDVIIPSETEKGGKDQKDLVATYTKKATRPDGGAVNLNFKHAFSQIEIKAHTGEKSVQKVYIRGVWFMNIASKATLYFTPGDNGNDNGNISWNTSTSAENVAYGKKFPIDPTESEAKKIRAHLLPSKEGTNNENLISTHDNTSMMLLPQNIGAYNFIKRDAGGDAYILFLCRIISEHKGDLTEDLKNALQDENNPNIHWHQLFPTNSEGTFRYGEYGYVCVPVDINWEPGKKYIYNIEFCGPSSGGGQYPPELPDGETFPGSDDDEITIVPRPNNKKPGDPVLDNPLTFKVTVEDWTEVPQDTPMH